MINLENAIKILETHNHWRRGNIDEVNYTVKELGEAIDLILKVVKKSIKLFNCPYDKSCKCAMMFPCIECEDFKTSKFNDENIEMETKQSNCTCSKSKNTIQNGWDILFA